MRADPLPTGAPNATLGPPVPDAWPALPYLGLRALHLATAPHLRRGLLSPPRGLEPTPAVAFRWRNIHTLNRQRLAMAVVLPLLIPLAVEVPALAALAGLAALLVGLVAYEVTRFGEARERLRRKLLHGEAV